MVLGIVLFRVFGEDGVSGGRLDGDHKGRKGKERKGGRLRGRTELVRCAHVYVFAAPLLSGPANAATPSGGFDFLVEGALDDVAETGDDEDWCA